MQMAARTTTSSVERHEADALGRARQKAPEQDPTRVMVDRDVDAYGTQRASTHSEDATAQDWVVAEAARPDFDDETPDGLSEMEEEVRHVAEDLPADEAWESRVRRKAHELWVSEGGPHGRAEDHWRIASQLVAEDDAGRSELLPYGDAIDQPVEEAATLDNLGEFPGLTDQGDDDGQSTEQNLERSGR